MKKVIMGIVALSLLAGLSACGDDTAKPVDDTADTTQQTEPVAPVEPDNIAPDEPTEPEAPKRLVGIPGSNIDDIRIGLKDSGGIPKGEINEAAETATSDYYCASSLDVAGAGVTLGYNLSADENKALISGTFSVTSQQIATDEDLLAFSKSYFSYCASVPYDTSDTQTAQAWVTDNLANFADDPETTIGDATYKLSGIRSGGSSAIADLTLTICVANQAEQLAALA